MFGKKGSKTEGVAKGTLTTKAKNRRKFYIFAAITLVNVFGISAATIAWFDVVAKSASMDAVSGDLNVSIEKVTAHKHVYPFYDNSTEFIDYDAPGQVKSYVAQDAGSATFNLQSGAGVCHTSETAGSVSDIYHDATGDASYYLVGNASFSGEGSPWSTSGGKTMTARGAVSLNIAATLESVSLSAGAEFILFDAGTVSGSAFTRYSYATSELNRRFELVTDEENANPRLKCLKSGIYDFVYSLVAGEDNGNPISIPTLSISLSKENSQPSFGGATTMTLTTQRAACHSNGTSGNKTDIHYETDHVFRYYLVGDQTFTGVTANPWSTSSGAAFSLQESVTTTKAATLSNVTVAVGAEFTFMDASTISTVNNVVGYSRFLYTITSSNPRFEVTPEGNLRCLKSGIYSFSYTLVEVNGSNVPTLTITPTRSDDAFIGNGILDLTMISIDFAGGRTGKSTIQDYLPVAIFNQKTMVVLDVALKLNNANKVDIGLEVRRTGTGASPSIYALSGAEGHTNDPYTNVTDYVSSVNTMNASDFYRFYAIVQEEELANPWAYFYENYWDPDEENTSYVGSSAFAKFSNDKSESFQSKIQCDLDHASNGNVYTIDPSPSVEAGKTYHCYIGIDYDDVHADFFLAPDRLGKTYHLERDFFFYFTGTQHLENGGGQQ